MNSILLFQQKRNDLNEINNSYLILKEELEKKKPDVNSPEIIEKYDGAIYQVERQIKSLDQLHRSSKDITRRNKFDTSAYGRRGTIEGDIKSALNELRAFRKTLTDGKELIEKFNTKEGVVVKHYAELIENLSDYHKMLQKLQKITGQPSSPELTPINHQSPQASDFLQGVLVLLLVVAFHRFKK